MPPASTLPTPTPTLTGRVTNETATNYVLRRTGGLNLDAWSGAAYWTHYGPGNWYIDAVAQATRYQGSASTQFAGLSTTGFGFVSSLEAGYPIQLPMFGPGFVLEPQAQMVWQRVSFDDANDGLGEVALGTTSGAGGRIGLRGKWTSSATAGRSGSLMCAPICGVTGGRGRRRSIPASIWCRYWSRPTACNWGVA